MRLCGDCRVEIGHPLRSSTSRTSTCWRHPIYSTGTGGLLRAVALQSRAGKASLAQDAREREALALRVVWDAPAFDVCKSSSYAHLPLPVSPSLSQQPGYRVRSADVS